MNYENSINVRVLGVDVSTSVMGWAIAENAKDLHDRTTYHSVVSDGGFVKISGNDIYDKAECAIIALREIIAKNQITHVCVESAMKFASNKKSSANIIMMLVSMNALVCYAILKEFKLELITESAVRARKSAWGTTFLSDKEKMIHFDEVAKAYQRKHLIYDTAIKQHPEIDILLTYSSGKGKKKREIKGYAINARHPKEHSTMFKLVPQAYDLIDACTMALHGYNTL